MRKPFSDWDAETTATLKQLPKAERKQREVARRSRADVAADKTYARHFDAPEAADDEEGGEDEDD